MEKGTWSMLLWLGWQEGAGSWPGLQVLSCISILATRSHGVTQETQGGAGVREACMGTQSWEGRQLIALIQMGMLSRTQLSLTSGLLRPPTNPKAPAPTGDAQVPAGTPEKESRAPRDASTSPPSILPAFSQDAGASLKVKLGFGLQIPAQAFPKAIHIDECAERAWGQEMGFVGLVFKCLLRMC